MWIDSVDSGFHSANFCSNPNSQFPTHGVLVHNLRLNLIACSDPSGWGGPLVNDNEAEMNASF